jgi:hypothetical protein
MQLNDQWTELIWAVTGPIIVPPSATGNKIPDDMVSRIKIERMIETMQKTELAAETEALWYVSCMSLEIPLDHDWYSIMMFLSRKYFLAIHKDQELPDFLEKATELEENQKQDLKRIREFIFKSSMTEVKRRMKEDRKNSAEVAQMKIDKFK